MMIAIDWGSSHFRALLLDQSGQVLRRSESDQGIFSHHFNDNRRDETFANIVKQHCNPWITEYGPLPYYLGGMIGSRSGWVETEYVDNQYWLSELSSNLVECGLLGGHIIPGIAVHKSSGNWDVMRGEEIQVFGALQSLDHNDCDQSLTACLPGTHSKWADIDIQRQADWNNVKIEDFTTYMTGELFQWAREKSSLAPLMNHPDTNGPENSDVNEDDFIQGVDASANNHPLSQSLFSIRANHLMALVPSKDNSDYLSGLLIGEEIRSALASNLDNDQRSVLIIGNPKLASRYRLALQQLNCDSRYIDGEQAFCQGVALIHKLTTHESRATIRPATA